MALKISLKPEEKIIINQAVIINGKHKSDLYLENKCAVLRAKDLMTQGDATTPSHVLYYLIQLHYLAADAHEDRKEQITKLLKDIEKAAPSLSELLAPVKAEIEQENFYKALKNCNKLIQQEGEILKHAS